MQVKVEINVAPATYQFGVALSSFLSELRGALADGWQPTSDIPEIILDAVRTLGPAVSQLDDILVESKGDKEAFMNALALTVVKVIGGAAK